MSTKISVLFENAVVEDLPEIISLLADDELGKSREAQAGATDSGYLTAFNEIISDPNNELIVGRLAGKVVAILQITYIPNLTLKGSKRAQIEGVRVSSLLRGQGVGRQLFEHALGRARANGCKLAQLTTNKTRPEAIRFYESLGFKATHEGFKLGL